MGKEQLRDVYAADGVVEAAEPLMVLRLGRGGRGARAVPAGPDRPPLGDRDPLLSPCSIVECETEAANLIVEKQRRGAHGYRNSGSYRLRLLLNHGVKWDTQGRGRQSQLLP
jgi:hypothetical protein